MQSGQPPTLIDGKLPVFVFPTSLTFYSDDQTSHKQVLTLYNPYEFTLKFKVLSTYPRKYSVVESEGYIKSRCCVDIVVRHKDISINHEGVKDKFRIQVMEYGQKTVIGKKDVLSVLLPTKEHGHEETFESMPPPMGSAPAMQQADLNIRSTRTGGLSGTGPNLVVITAAIFCILALMMPTEGETESSLPTYLHLSQHQKLIAAYILGLVTMALLKS